jgi:hypothetical protein
VTRLLGEARLTPNSISSELAGMLPKHRGRQTLGGLFSFKTRRREPAGFFDGAGCRLIVVRAVD